VDENTLRFAVRRGKKKINIDVKYNFGTDYYDITAYRVGTGEFKTGWEKIYSQTDVGWEELNETIGRIATGRTSGSFESFMPTTIRVRRRPIKIPKAPKRKKTRSANKVFGSWNSNMKTILAWRKRGL
jgi:hypothetical protein